LLIVLSVILVCLLEVLWVDKENDYSKLVVINDPYGIPSGVGEKSVVSCCTDCGVDSSSSNCVKCCRLASVKMPSLSKQPAPALKAAKKPSVFRNPFHSRLDPSINMKGAQVDTSSTEYDFGFEEGVEHAVFDNSVAVPTVVAFDGTRTFVRKYYSHNNSTKQTNRKHFVRIDMEALPVQRLFGFVNLNAYCRGGMYFMDRCWAKEGGTADYPKGRECIIMRVLLTACCAPYEAVVVCYPECSENLYSMFCVVRLCECFVYVPAFVSPYYFLSR
jgi:hypothetical protein